MARCNRCKCQSEAVEGRKFCQYHLDLFKYNAEKKRKRRKENNRCHSCGKPKEQTNKLRCNRCLEISRQEYKERFIISKQLGLCATCSNPKNNGRSSVCDNCAERDNARQKIKRIYCKENNLCYKCYQPLKRAVTMCLKCSIKANIRKNIIYALRKKNIPKSARTEEILGCKIEKFREHIESLMEPWMNESNYGIHIPGERRWNLGHSLPTAAYNPTNLEQLKKCFYYKNIFPQEAKENAELQDWMFLDGQLVRGRDIRS